MLALIIKHYLILVFLSKFLYLGLGVDFYNILLAKTTINSI